MSPDEKNNRRDPDPEVFSFPEQHGMTEVKIRAVVSKPSLTRRAGRSSAAPRKILFAN